MNRLEFYTYRDKSDLTFFDFDEDSVFFDTETSPITDDTFENSIIIQSVTWDIFILKILCNQDTLRNISRLKSSKFANIEFENADNVIIDTTKGIDINSALQDVSGFSLVTITYYTNKVVKTPALDLRDDKLSIRLKNKTSLGGELNYFDPADYRYTFYTDIEPVLYDPKTIESGEYLNAGVKNIEVQYGYRQYQWLFYLSESEADKLALCINKCSEVTYNLRGETAFSNQMISYDFESVESNPVKGASGIRQVNIVFKTKLIENYPKD